MTTTQAPEKTPNAFQRGVNAVIDLLSSFFLPIINLLVSVGILKGILTLLQVSGMVTDDSTTYAILNAMADSLFYFIPVFLAYTSSKRFDVDTVTAVLLGCILVYPSITTIMAADAPVYLFGLELSKATYSSSVIPILLAIYCASWVQKACYKIIPETFRGLFTPPITIIVIVPLTLAVFGPLGTIVGGWLAHGYEADYKQPLAARRRRADRRVPAVPRHPRPALGPVPHCHEQRRGLRLRHHHGPVRRRDLRPGRCRARRRPQD